ncbi:MAG TPA: helix-turn-helix transcriptional regulator [Candidatus Limnocylindria bacterium]|nr:helix-turn-helix transcriptional regulator [Candidatus Limnocylindria bacterium]
MTAKTWAQIKRDRVQGGDVVAGYHKARAGYILAERVRALRVAGGLSQGQLAERMGTTQSAISRLEAGGVYPSIDTLEKIGRALHAKLVVEFDAINMPVPKKASSLMPNVRALRRSAAGSILRARRSTTVARTTGRAMTKRAAKKSAKR